MIARSLILGAASAAVIFTGMLVAAPAPAGAESCKQNLRFGRATGLLRATAGIAARADWRREVASRDGPEYTRWSRARSRVTSCRKPESGTWRCTARAKPCAP